MKNPHLPPPLCLLIWVLLLSAAPHAPGLEPNEVVLVVNQQSPGSKEVAETYASLRHIPQRNIITVNAAPVHRSRTATISRKEFLETIWQPIGKAVLVRKIDKEIVAIIYSTGFPTTISTAPPMSLTGITYTAGENPGAEVIKKGNFISPFFAGPSEPNGPMRAGKSLRAIHDRTTGPLPPSSMILGFDGPRGMSTKEVIQQLKRSKAADFSQPTAPVYALDIKDVRSKCRRWQLEQVQSEMLAQGESFRIQSSWPAKEVLLGGFLTGMPVLPEYRTYEFAPGALADHLTSLAAHYYSPLQTKNTLWLRAGASASCGTVAEPYAIWTKFPHARLHVHYRSGLPALEAYMAAVACPFQLLLIGDPFAQPFATEQQPKKSASLPERVGVPEKQKLEADRFDFADEGKFAFAFPTEFERQTKLEAKISWVSDRLFSSQGFSGLVYNYQSPTNFDFFGLHGYGGYWMMASRRGDKWMFHEVWGEPITMNTIYKIGVSLEQGRIVGTINGRITCQQKTNPETWGKSGLLQSGELISEFSIPHE